MTVHVRVVRRRRKDGSYATYRYVEFLKHRGGQVWDSVYCGPASEDESWKKAYRLEIEWLEEQASDLKLKIQVLNRRLRELEAKE